MKRIIFLLGIILLSCLSIQAQDPFKGWSYATQTTPLGRTVSNGEYILVASTGVMYKVTKTFGSSATAASIVTDGHYVAFPSASGGTVQTSKKLLPASTDTITAIYMYDKNGKKWAGHITLLGVVYWATVTP